MLSLSILFYLPYILHTFYNNDTLSSSGGIDFSLNPLPDMITNLKGQYKPLYGFFRGYLEYKIGVSPQILVLLGVIFFSIAIYGFLSFFTRSLSKISKLGIYLLAFCNPYIFTESGWWGQFMGQGLVSCFYLASFIYIDRYKNLRNSFKKMALAYALPIFSVVFGLNFFMPSFFHFIVLAFLYVIKNHLEKLFSSFKEFFIFSLPVLTIISLGAIIYIIEIKGLFYLLDIKITDGRANNYILLDSLQMLKERLIIVWNYYPKAYNCLALICTAFLFFIVKHHRLNIIFILLTPLVMLVSYSFFILLNMHSTRIVNFVNYYLFVFLLAFIVAYLKNSRLQSLIKIASFMLVALFYFSSYFWAVWGLHHEKVIKTELAKLEQVAYSQFEKGSEILIIGNIADWDKKLIKAPKFVNKLFTRHGYGLKDALSWAFKGYWYGFKNIRRPYLPNEDRLRVAEPIKQVKLLRSQGKIYPSNGSIFLHNGTIYVVGN